MAEPRVFAPRGGPQQDVGRNNSAPMPTARPHRAQHVWGRREEAPSYAWSGGYGHGGGFGVICGW
jgi:hypothetical protein